MYRLYPQPFRHFKTRTGKLYEVTPFLIVTFEMVLIDYIRDMNSMKIIAWGTLDVLGFGIMPFDVGLVLCFSMVIITVGEMMSMPIARVGVGQRSEREIWRDAHGWFTMTYSLVA